MKGLFLDHEQVDKSAYDCNYTGSCFKRIFIDKSPTTKTYSI